MAAKKKKKVARKGKDYPSDDDLDAWAGDLVPKSGCKTCAHEEASETIRNLLKAIIRANALHITLRQIHQKLHEVHQDYAVGYYGFRAHLRDHEGELYRQARGKE